MTGEKTNTAHTIRSFSCQDGPSPSDGGNLTAVSWSTIQRLCHEGGTVDQHLFKRTSDAHDFIHFLASGVNVFSVLEEMGSNSAALFSED